MRTLASEMVEMGTMDISVPPQLTRIGRVRVRSLFTNGAPVSPRDPLDVMAPIVTRTSTVMLSAQLHDPATDTSSIPSNCDFNFVDTLWMRHDDVMSLVASCLSLRDVRSLSCCSRKFSTSSRPLFKHLHRLCFDDIRDMAESDYARGLPEPSAMLKLGKLDLDNYLATQSPCRPAKLSRLTRCDSQDDASPAADALGRSNWLMELLNSRVACARLRTLRMGSLVPRWMQEKLLSSCTGLRSISLRGCERHTDDLLLASVAAAASRLTAVDLNGCWRIGQRHEELEAMRQNGHSDVVVPEHGLVALLRSCPGIEKVRVYYVGLCVNWSTSLSFN